MATVRLTVDAAGDVLRAERLTRRLRDHLGHYEGLDVDFQPPPVAEAGAKGTVETLALVVAATPLAKPAASVLAAALSSWFERNKNNSVVVERDGARIELTGQSGARQQRLLDQLLGDADRSSEREPDAR